MTCPFARGSNSLRRQSSVVEQNSNWGIEDDFAEIPDALTLTHLQAAIQLLTSPLNEDVNTAVTSLISKYQGKWPGLSQLKMDVQNHPNYDYLADIQDILLKMDESSASEILVLLGEELIATCCTGIVERAFRSLGADLQEFLGALEGVHDVLKLQEDGQTDTDFICADEGELIFTSERPVIAWLLLGSLKALTRILYDINASIVIEPIEGDPKCYRYLFTLSEQEKNRLKLTEIEQDVSVPISGLTATDLKMSPATFCKAFPWHFIMNEDLEIIQMGKGFSKLFKNSLPTHGRLVTTYVIFKRPTNLTIKFRDIIRRSNTPFVLSLKPLPGVKYAAEALDVKGRMVFCPESNSILFIGSPFIDGLDGLTCNNLFISDIPLHDATREVILVGEQTKAQDGLRRRMDKLKNSIEEGNAAVAKERKKNVSLLYLIFPAEIAESLWLGSTIDAKTYPDVTMLFSDIVGFTSICSRATPFMVISMLEELYKEFDEACGYFDVYKVETIGDAYCVASGLHRAGSFDAHKVAWMALRMMEACSKHITHDSQPIRMRIGIHTGTVLAGVVGRKMPRYCLFGHNVTIANKFESNSIERKINISNTTREWLMKHPDFKYELTARDPSCLPKEYTNAEGNCYFLDGYKHSTVTDENASLGDHIEAGMRQIME
ncbi:head-specific guanylate cyclase [Contarinia nasturtii]|uniref:head-specific guanylate cyclase n=1 Tax=Contarinia nasturtii TaxID=265458 RepID=UPI0012D4A64A|nr:head-specific guanylate cyclase [Contarinia nasturtii]